MGENPENSFFGRTIGDKLDRIDPAGRLKYIIGEIKILERREQDPDPLRPLSDEDKERLADLRKELKGE